MARELKIQSPPGRPKRTPVGARNRLTVSNKEAGFIYRFVNDEDDRVELFKENGWEVAPAKDVQIGQGRRVDVASPEGSASVISVGGGQRAALMRIPEDWYKADQAEKQAEIVRLEQTMKEDAQHGNYGKLEIS